MRLLVHRKDGTPIRMDDLTIRVSRENPNHATLIVHNPDALVILREVPPPTAPDHDQDKDKDAIV
jgi:hypothetical protein